jgi:hypothetical protein
MFCTNDCFKQYCLATTGNSLANLADIKCKMCDRPVHRDLIVHAFGGEDEIDHFKQAENDRVTRQLIPETYADEHPKLEFTCEICGEVFPYHEGVVLDCRHRFCTDCFNGYVENKIEENQVSEEEMLCPNAKCGRPIGYARLRSNSDSKLFARYDKLLGNLIPASKDELTL